MSAQPRISAREEQGSSRLTYDLATTANGVVRLEVRRLLSRYSGLIVDDAVLVTDELVSNANRHGHGPRTCHLELTDDENLLIEVNDASPDQPRIRSPHAGGGRGLVLVDRLASAWGVRNFADHKTVWAQLALDRDGSSGRTRHLTTAEDWHVRD
ncbi:ATP-binding protein [Amycolatopsis sp. lyj-90]|uniref:ATP-binding protein n=1 Tax=Amycolatopsis sp. lyj-90 TaxID=2789285 RepID=UPI00397C17BF